MKNFRFALLFCCCALGLAPMAAQAAALAVVNVAAPGINCVFNTSCTVTVYDNIGKFTPPGDGGTAILQSRNYPGLAPAIAAGDMAYVYRLDMTQVSADAAPNCVTKVALKFGPALKLPYDQTGKSSVFVVTAGGLGSTGIASATQSRGIITFTFTEPVCPGATSYFFGLASKSNTPQAANATLYYSQGGSTTTDVHIP